MEHTIDRGDRKGVYLVVADSTEEFMVAVDRACAFANAEGGYVALLTVIEEVHFQNWQNIEDRVKREMREQAEQMAWDAAGHVVERTGTMPIICIEEGARSERILKTIDDNKNIVALVLASEAHSTNPGPLLNYFSGKGLSKLNIPLIVVPGHLEN